LKTIKTEYCVRDGVVGWRCEMLFQQSLDIWHMWSRTYWHMMSRVLRWSVVATLLEELTVFTIPVVRDVSLLGLGSAVVNRSLSRPTTTKRFRLQ